MIWFSKYIKVASGTWFCWLSLLLMFAGRVLMAQATAPDTPDLIRVTVDHADQWCADPVGSQ